VRGSDGSTRSATCCLLDDGRYEKEIDVEKDDKKIKGEIWHTVADEDIES
jgi:hypothetical protein